MLKTTTQVRIHSIDALRGVTLLGIFLVHVAGMYGYGIQDYNTALGNDFIRLLLALLNNRCAPIFSMLFGVSFYLILRNPEYTGGKFFWRCFLLMLIGILNKFFYTWDVLMWYAILGMCLLLFRNTPPRMLLIISMLLIALSSWLAYYNIGDMIFSTNTEVGNRYVSGNTMSDVLSYPITWAIKDNLRLIFNGGIFTTFSYFILGYYLGRRGVVENLNSYVTNKSVALFWSIYIIFALLYKSTNLILFEKLFYLTGAVSMAMLFIWIYNKKETWFRFLESYGKLGLTNYSMQNYVGITFVAMIVIPYKISFEYAIILFLGIYACQCLFSYVWLIYFKYGPFEWIWRCMTNLKYIKLSKSVSV